MDILDISFLILSSKEVQPEDIKTLSKIQIDLIEAIELINMIISPIMAISFGIGFCMFCVYAFTSFIFSLNLWFKNPFSSIIYFILNGQFTFTLIGVLWICEATIQEECEIVKTLFKIMTQSDDQLYNKKVKFS